MNTSTNTHMYDTICTLRNIFCMCMILFPDTAVIVDSRGREQHVDLM